VCDLQTSTMSSPRPQLGCCDTENTSRNCRVLYETSLNSHVVTEDTDTVRLQKQQFSLAQMKTADLNTLPW
jgi:hypothetical protein